MNANEKKAIERHAEEVLTPVKTGKLNDLKALIASKTAVIDPEANTLREAIQSVLQDIKDAPSKVEAASEALRSVDYEYRAPAEDLAPLLDEVARLESLKKSFQRRSALYAGLCQEVKQAQADLLPVAGLPEKVVRSRADTLRRLEQKQQDTAKALSADRAEANASERLRDAKANLFRTQQFFAYGPGRNEKFTAEVGKAIELLRRFQAAQLAAETHHDRLKVAVTAYEDLLKSRRMSSIQGK